MTAHEVSTRPSSVACCGVPVLAGALCVAIRAGGLDVEAFRAVHALASERHALGWLTLSALGEGTVLLALAFLLRSRSPDLLWRLLVVALLTILVSDGLKELVDAPRPLRVLGAEEVTLLGPRRSSRSFPSGHASAAFAAAAMFVLSRLRVPRGARPSVLLPVLAVLAATAVALSRVVIGVHWPSDVLGGVAAGWTCAALGLALADRWRWGLSSVGRPVVALVYALAAVAVAMRDMGLPPALAPWRWGAAALVLAVGLPRWWRARRAPPTAVAP